MKPAYCIINESKNRLYRVTFSRSLAEHIVKHHATDCSIIKAIPHIVEGSAEGSLYGVVDTKSKHLLRIPITLESAQMYTQCESRHIERVKLEFIGLRQSQKKAA